MRRRFLQEPMLTLDKAIGLGRTNEITEEQLRKIDCKEKQEKENSNSTETRIVRR